jgi:integrase
MSKLDARLNDYLKLRRQLGFKLSSAGCLLRNFVRFAEAQGSAFITTKMALRWATLPQNIQLAQKSYRLAKVRGFAKYLSAIDSRTEVPPQKLLPNQYYRKKPYLYRPEEIIELMEGSRKLAAPNKIKGETHATLIGLLAATGMRVGEALGLDRDDVDLKQGLLTVRKAKGNKTRLVPIHSSTKAALQKYLHLQERDIPRVGSDRFFLSEKGTPLRQNAVNQWFLFVSCKIGLRATGSSQGPRLHDLRHYFAIGTLLKWYRSKTDVEAHLPELTTYLGHVHVRDTYWYFTSTPELLKLATLRLERAGKGAR